MELSRNGAFKEFRQEGEVGYGPVVVGDVRVESRFLQDGGDEGSFHALHEDRKIGGENCGELGQRGEGRRRAWGGRTKRRSGYELSVDIVDFDLKFGQEGGAHFSYE